MRAYSMDRRQRVLADCDEGMAATAVAEAPDATLGELKERLGLAISLATLWRAVAALGLTVKKKSSGPPSATAPTSRRSGPNGPRPSRGSTRPS